METGNSDFGYAETLFEVSVNVSDLPISCIGVPNIVNARGTGKVSSLSGTAELPANGETTKVSSPSGSKRASILAKASKLGAKAEELGLVLSSVLSPSRPDWGISFNGGSVESTWGRVPGSVLDSFYQIGLDVSNVSSTDVSVNAVK